MEHDAREGRKRHQSPCATLLNFSFADRTYQKRRIDGFVGAEPESILWVHGPAGVGLTRVLEELIKPSDNEEVIYVDLPEQGSFNAFLTALQNNRKTKLDKYLRKYKLVQPSALKAGSSMLLGAAAGSWELAFTAHSALSLLQDTLTFFKPRAGGESVSGTTVVRRYLAKSPKSKCVVVIDNFSRCDQQSAEMLCEIILSFVDGDTRRMFGGELNRESHVYFVLATHDDELGRRRDIEKMLRERIPHINLSIGPLKNPRHFSHMLSNAFDLTGKGDVVEHLMRVCQGNPKRLEDVVFALYRSEPRIVAENHAKISVPDVQRALESRNGCSTDFDFDNYRFPTSLFLRVIGGSLIPWPATLLRKALDDFAEEHHYTAPVSQDRIDEAIDTLLERFCKASYRASGELIRLKDGNVRSQVKAAYEAESSSASFDRWLHAFLLKEREHFIKSEVDPLSVRRAICDCAWRSDLDRKRDEGFWYALDVMNSGNYLETAEVFERFAPEDAYLTLRHRTIMASCFYRIGRYETAYRYLEAGKQDAEHIDENQRPAIVSYLCTLAKTESILLKEKGKALEHVDRALGLVNSPKLRSEILSIKQSIVTNLGASRATAKRLFEEAKSCCPPESRNSLAYAQLLSTSVDFYRGEKAQEDLALAGRIADQYDDPSLLGAVVTNRGFDAFWQGNIREAAKLSVEAVRILSGCRLHEISYPLNNLANCQMMLGKFDKATQTLERALLWNKSEYLDFTLNTALMVALSFAEDGKRPFELASYLLNKMKGLERIDISIELNVYYNVEFVYRSALRNPPFSKGKAIDLARQQDPANLPYLWFENLRSDIEEDLRRRVPKRQAGIFYANRFEPWLVTLTHDNDISFN